jgi:hypothetical protein
VENLNRPEPIFRLTDVRLPGQTTRHDFFALERAAVIAVIPADGGGELFEAPGAGARAAHRTSWLLPNGAVVDGALDLMPGVRVSDHLVHRTGFLQLHDCTLFWRDEAGASCVEPQIPAIALHAGRAIGASELSG